MNPGLRLIVLYACAVVAFGFVAQSDGEQLASNVSVNVNSASAQELAPLAKCGIDVATLQKKNADGASYPSSAAFTAAVKDSPACRSLSFKLSAGDPVFRLPAKRQASTDSAGGDVAANVSINVNSANAQELAPLAKCGIDVAALQGKNISGASFPTRNSFLAVVKNSPACRSLTFKLSPADPMFRLKTTK